MARVISKSLFYSLMKKAHYTKAEIDDLYSDMKMGRPMSTKLHVLEALADGRVNISTVEEWEAKP